MVSISIRMSRRFVPKKNISGRLRKNNCGKKIKVNTCVHETNDLIHVSLESELGHKITHFFPICVVV